MSIRILFADDHKLIREGIRALIASEKDMEVVAEAENGYNAVALVIHHTPDIVMKNKFYLSSEIIGTVMDDYSIIFLPDRRIIGWAVFFGEF